MLLLGLAAACGGDTTAPIDHVVPIAIVAAPATDTVLLGDSVVLRVTSDSGAQPDHVLWQVIVPTDTAPDTTTQDTLVFRPRRTGSAIVRAEAVFADGASGSAEQVFQTPSSRLPTIVINPVGPDSLAYQRSVGDTFGVLHLPVGDTIALRAHTADPAEALPGPVRWYAATIGGDSVSLLGTGDTLRLATDSVGWWRFAAFARNDAGATASAYFGLVTYDPITPAAWRTHLANRLLAYSPDGTIIVNDGYDGEPTFYCGCVVSAVDTQGAVRWRDSSGAAGRPLVVGDDGGIYLASGDLVRLARDGTPNWSGPQATFGPAVLPDGRLVVASNPIFPDSSLVLEVLHPNGSESWRDTLTSMPPLQSLAIGGDSTIYAYGTPSVYGSTVAQALAAVRPDSGVRWTRAVPLPAPYPSNIYPSSAPFVVPADDTTLLVTGDSLYAFGTDGNRRWASGAASRYFAGAVVVDAQRAFVVSRDQVHAISIADGGEVWSAPLSSTHTSGGPIVTADGRVLIANENYVIGFDAASGAEVWRHQMAGWVTDLLLTKTGLLVIGDGTYLEAVRLGTAPAPSPWPMPWGDAQHTGRMQRP